MIASVIRDFTLIISWPDSSLFPNRSNGHHWSSRQEAKKAARIAAHFQSIGHCIGSNTNDHAVTIIIAPPDKRKRDIDGVLSALKPTLDGLADGLIIDDERFNPIEIRRVEPCSGGQVTIIVHDDIPF